MQKTILITGSTDGIGYETAKRFVKEGHNVIVHGRNAQKVQRVKGSLLAELGDGSLESFVADLSDMNAVKSLAQAIKMRYQKLDVVINNAGVYKVPTVKNSEGLDVRFVVNTIAPYLLTKLLLPILITNSRVVNLSSAAQAPVNINALSSYIALGDSEAYVQSKLALTMWSTAIAPALKEKGIMVVSVNPKSFIGSKMVKEAYGMQGVDVNFGVDILHRASLSSEFENAHGKYFDNDRESFSSPHPDALDGNKNQAVVNVLEESLKEYL